MDPIEEWILRVMIPHGEPCPSTNDLLRYLDGAEGPWREGIERHLSLCAACRWRLVEAHEGRKPHPTVEASEWLRAQARRVRRRRAPMVAAWLAAAASVLAVVGLSIVSLRETEKAPPGDPLRDRLGAGEGLPALRAPAPGDILQDPLRFEWEPLKQCSTYVLTVLDGKGDIVARRETSRASYASGAGDLGLRAGASYHWYVTARCAVAPQRRSEIRTFALQAAAP